MANTYKLWLGQVGHVYHEPWKRIENILLANSARPARISYGFSHSNSIFPWFSQGFMVFPWFSHGFPMVKWDVKPLNSTSPRLQIPAPGEAHITGVAIRVAGAGGTVAAPGGVRQILTGLWMVILWYFYGDLMGFNGDLMGF